MAICRNNTVHILCDQNAKSKFSQANLSDNIRYIVNGCKIWLEIYVSTRIHTHTHTHRHRHRHAHTHAHAHTHTHTFNGPFSWTTRVSRYQKGKPIWILLKQETVSAPHSRQITTPAPHHSVFLQAGCPSCHPTNIVKALKLVQEYTFKSNPH